MRFGILGPTQVRLTDGRQVTVGGPRLRALLAALLLDAGKVVSGERLIDGLYGATPPADATNALQSQVSRLRQALRAGDAPVEFHPAGYRLAIDPDDVDAHRFERAAAEGHRALADGDLPRAAALLREALGLWRGPALADVRDMPFAPAAAARLEELRLAAVEDRVEADLAAGGVGQLVPELTELVAEQPLRERLRAQLMRALYGSGRQAEALAVFDDARRTLVEELGVEPSAELAAVRLAILRAEPPARAAGAAAVSPRQGLPAQFTSFVGRAEEVRRVGKLLGEARLVTLTGPGGAGKTRLAVEAAGRELADTCFVELAPLRDGADVPLAVLGAVGLRDAGLLQSPDRQPADPTDKLVAALADTRLLLVLDNCEHVVEAAATLTHRLLTACPGVRVLTTSREALGITGESLCPVPPLALPPVGSTALATLDYAAVQLFADRAAAVRPGFAVDVENADAVLRICRALDGMPLAIELAAARLRSLAVTELAVRLDDRFRLLTRGNRSAERRHQTLRAVVGWSWDLLDEAEQTLARRLTVFAGGATLEAGEQVCGLPATDVLDALTSLADKSLIEAVDGGRRYRMLDTVRAFCAERADEAGEREELRHAHAAYYLALAQTADPHLRRAEQLEWLERLDAERDNLHDALRQSIAAEPETALRLHAALAMYWWLRGLRTEGTALAAELLDAVGPRTPPGLEEEYALCVLAVASAGSHGEELRALVRTVGSLIYAPREPPRHPFVTVLWAMATGPPEGEVAAELLRRPAALGDDPWLAALTKFGWGITHLFSGDVDMAEAELTAALDGFRTLGERWGLLTTLGEMADFAEWRGDRDRSRAMTAEALELAEQLGSTEDMADLLARRATASLRIAELADAEADFTRSAELARLAGAPEKFAGARHGLAEVARLRGDLAAARRHCEEALAACPTNWFGADSVRMRILVSLGQIAEAEGDAEGAMAWQRRALAALRGPIGVTDAAAVATGLAGAALLAGDAARAALLLGVRRALHGTPSTGDPDLTRLSAGALAELGEPAYRVAYGRGAAMAREEGLATIGAPAGQFAVPPHPNVTTPTSGR